MMMIWAVYEHVWAIGYRFRRFGREYWGRRDN
jgi:hypothetical protein